MPSAPACPPSASLLLRDGPTVSTGPGGRGAFEVVGRYGVLERDDDTFPLPADPAVSASEAFSRMLGLDWYLTSNLKLVLDYPHTSLESGAADGVDREDGKAVFTRLQVAF